MLKFKLASFVILICVIMSHATTIFDVTASAYGANGNDNNADNVAIQSAIDAARVYSPEEERIIYFPKGTYIIDSPLYVGLGTGTTSADKGNHIKIQGEDRNATTILVRNAVDGIIFRGGVVADTGWGNDNMISNITIGKTSGSTSGGVAINFTNSYGSKIKNVYIYANRGANFQCGVKITRWCLTVDSVKVDAVQSDSLSGGPGTINHGIELGLEANSTLIHRCELGNCGVGMYISGEAGNTISNNSIEGCDTTGICIYAERWEKNLGLSIIGNYLEGNGDGVHNAIWIEKTGTGLSRAISISGNYISFSGIENSSGGVPTSPYEIADEDQLRQCTFNRNAYRDYDGNAVSEGVAIGSIPTATTSTASPLFDVNGDATVRGSLNVIGNDNDVGIKQTDSLGNLRAFTYLSSGNAGIYVRNSANNNQAVLNSIGSGSLNLFDASKNNQVSINGSGNSYINGGNVGIGTSTPGDKLDVAGNVAISSSTHGDLILNSATRPTIYPEGSNTPTDLNFQIRSKGAGAMQINQDNAGNVIIAGGGGSVGINTAAPGRKLHIKDTSAPPLKYECTTASSKTGVSLYIPIDVNGTTYYLKLYQ